MSAELPFRVVLETIAAADLEELSSLPAGVAILHEDGVWYCECSFLDYLSTGETPAEAIRNFRLGLQLTILANLESSGRFAPQARPSYDLEFALKEAAA